jgi:ubiquinone/menaquinone biosynthesis C-methylase UbiE
MSLYANKVIPWLLDAPEPKEMAEQLPFDGSRFDTVVIADVLCSVDNVDAVLREAFRVLKPGGGMQ